MHLYPHILSLAHTLAPFDVRSFGEFVAFHTRELPDASVLTDMIVSEVQMTAYDSITSEQLLDSAILIAAQNIQHDPDYERVATRLSLTKNYLTSLDWQENYGSFDDLYTQSFYRYIALGIETHLITPDIASLFDLTRIAHELQPQNDDIFSYIGMLTLQNRYMLRNRAQAMIETPQFTWMRVAMGMALREKQPTDVAIQFYHKLSTLEYIPGGSTIIGAGTTHPMLSNCYLLDTEDDITHIFENVKNVAMISKATGGIGLSLTKLRAEGSPIHSNNTFSSGPIPFAHVIDSTIRAVSRAGKKMGALALYMENWHYNFPEFLDLKQNAGDDYRRTRTADTAAYLSDEFMKRVVTGDMWYLFDPAEVPELPELYGEAFSRKYRHYVEKAERGEMRMVRQIPAREQLKKILMSLQSTSHPWLTWKDTINLRALNNNTGTIHCSNLCTEVCLPQDRDNIAVCNLLYVNLVKHVVVAGDGSTKIDWKRFDESIRLGMRHLDNLIDVNILTVAEARQSDQANRAVGLGILGFSEALELFGFGYESEDAYDLIDEVMEFVSYTTIDESADLATERGSYHNFEGSLWSEGMVPFDTIEKVERERNWETATHSHTSKAVESLGQLIDAKDDSFSSAEKAQIQALLKTIQEQEHAQTSQNYRFQLEQNRATHLNWNRLREKVKQGMRNATTMMIAPNASTGLVASTTPGIDPRFAQMFSRTTSNGKFLDINKNLVSELKKLGIWEQVRAQVLENYGDISSIPGIPDSLKAIYKTSFQISPHAFIEVASRAQKWIDQSMSRNMYLETRDIDEMIDIYTSAWKKGLKTTYYLHVKPRHNAEQSTAKVNKAQDMQKKGFGGGFGGVVQAVAPLPVTQKEETATDFGLPAAPEVIPKPTKMPKIPHISRGGFSASIARTAAPAQAVEKTMAVQKIMPAEKKDAHFACPIDPMERAKCEGCQ
jgi:ribonucleoside-diphosphate reductase alpha chain